MNNRYRVSLKQYSPKSLHCSLFDTNLVALIQHQVHPLVESSDDSLELLPGIVVDPNLHPKPPLHKLE